MSNAIERMRKNKNIRLGKGTERLIYPGSNNKDEDVTEIVDMIRNVSIETSDNEIDSNNNINNNSMENNKVDNENNSNNEIHNDNENTSVNNNDSESMDNIIKNSDKENKDDSLINNDIAINSEINKETVHAYVLANKKPKFEELHRKDNFWIENERLDKLNSLTKGTKGLKTKIINEALDLFFKKHKV